MFFRVTAALIALSVIGAPLAYGQKPRIKKRCEDDNLNSPQALGRIDWTLHCAQKQVQDNWNKAGLPQVPYSEVAKATREELTTVRGYPRKNPLYPSFSTPNLEKGWKAPIADENTCRSVVPPGYIWGVDCVASCYTPEERLLFASGYVPIVEAEQENLQDLQVVTKTSTLRAIGLRSIGVDDYISSVRDTNHTVLTFSMESGGQLTVTPNHPLLNKTGHIKLAEQFKVGDSLLTKSGAADAILSIEPSEYFGKVYNVMPSSEHLKANVLVAEGYLTGSAWYQNEGAGYISRRILRESIPLEQLTRD